MTVFTVQDTTYYYPDNLHDVKAKVFLDYLQQVEPTFPVELTDLWRAEDELRRVEPEIQRYEKKLNADRDAIMEIINQGTAPKKTAHYFPELYTNYQAAKETISEIQSRIGINWRATKYYPYVCKVVHHFTGIPMDTLEQMNLGDLDFLFDKINAVVNTLPDDEGKSVFLINGKRYELGEKLMTKSTLIEFAESAQFEQDMEQLRNGSHLALLDIASVLLRLPGEAYSEYAYQRNRIDFADHMTMHDLYQVGFFFHRLSTRYGAAFLNYTLEGNPEQISSYLSGSAGI